MQRRAGETRRQPSMAFETRTEELLASLLPAADPARAGACIEIGVGTYHWYCDLFAKAGYRSIAVEPIPAAPFLERLERGDIVFYEGVVGDRDGSAAVYLSRDGDANLSSTQSDWWAVSKNFRTVRSLTLATLVQQSRIERITCLKVDAEGSEAEILRQLVDFQPVLLPRVVVFEFGAAVCAQGRWLDHFHTGTMECLRILRARGYGRLHTIDVFSQERIGDLQGDLAPEPYFGPDSQAGNAIAERAP